LFGDLAVPICILGLIGLRTIPVELKPVHPVQNGLHGLFGGTLAVRVLDPQQELPPMMFGEQVVEQSRPRPADMQKSGG